MQVIKEFKGRYGTLIVTDIGVVIKRGGIFQQFLRLLTTTRPKPSPMTDVAVQYSHIKHVFFKKGNIFRGYINFRIKEEYEPKEDQSFKKLTKAEYEVLLPYWDAAE